MVCTAAIAWAEAQMLAPRYAHSAMPLADGRVSFYGGLGPGDGFMLGTETLDPATAESKRRYIEFLQTEKAEIGGYLRGKLNYCSPRIYITD